MNKKQEILNWLDKIDKVRNLIRIKEPIYYNELALRKNCNCVYKFLTDCSKEKQKNLPIPPNWERIPTLILKSNLITLVELFESLADRCIEVRQLVESKR